jgi:hypothetical protein
MGKVWYTLKLKERHFELSNDTNQKCKRFFFTQFIEGFYKFILNISVSQLIELYLI